MALINYSEYFDLDGFNSAIKTLDSTNKEFGASVLSLNKEIKSSYGGIRGELKDYADILSKFNVNQRDAGARLAEVSAASSVLRGRFEEQQAAMQGLTQVQELSNRSVKELKNGLKELQTQYTSLGGASDDAKAKKAALAAEARRLKEAIDLQNSALKVTKVVVEEAAGSYNALSLEARQILKDLKTMPGAFDAITGKINQNNAEAVKLSGRYIELNGTLKNIDAGLGNFQRNVGNYKSGFNGLGNSINQITREFPSFANSVQTGFMALSNNIPIFFDEIEKTNKGIKAMRAEGQQVPSLFSALASSVFSFGTVLSLGVTLLTIYGKDLVTFVEKIIAGAKGIDTAKENMKNLNEAFKEGDKEAGKEITTLKILYDAATNVNESMATRVKAAEELKKIYPEQFKNLNTEVILNGESKKSYDDLTESIIKTSRAKAAKSKIDEIEAQLLENEFQKQKIKNATTNEANRNQADLRSGILGGISGGAVPVGPDDAQGLKVIADRREKALKAVDATSKSLIDQRDFLVKYVGEDNLVNAIIGKPKDTSDSDAKKALREYERMLKDREAALKAAYEAEVALAQEQLDNRLIDEVGFQKSKQSAALKYSVEGVKLENAANNVGYKADEARVQEFINFKKKADNDYNRAAIKANDDARKEDIVLLQQSIQESADYQIESLKSTQTFVLSNQQLTNLERKQLELDFQNEIDEITIKALKDRAEIELDTLKKNEMLKKAALLENAMKERTELANKVTLPRAAADDQIKSLERILNAKKTFGIATTQDELATAITIRKIHYDTNQSIIEDDKKILDLKYKSQQEMVGYLRASSNVVRQELGQGFGDLFDTMISDAQKFANEGKLSIDDYAKTAIAAGQAITDSRKANIAAEMTALQDQKAQELAAVGNNASAQAAINAKYKREENALKRKQAKVDRDNALFQIAINTVIAVSKAVAESPLTFGLPWSAVALAIGAVQAAVVLSKPLPQFKKGTEHSPEGPAIVDEAGPELIVGPDGKIREIGGKGPRITYLEKGSKVKTASETKRLLQSNESAKIIREIEMLSKASANMNSYKHNEAIYVMGQALQKSGMNDRMIIDAFEKAISKIPINQTIIDREGERLRVIDGNNRTTYLNSFKISR